jgi:sensor histidine kinase YesM
VLRVNVSAAVYVIIACLAHAFSYYRRAQDREKEAIAASAGWSRAKLDALRLQLQPHFLFNTLNAISTLVHRDANAADELIGDLSELLRLSLQTTEHEVPLSRELELLECYLAIEQTRLGERLRIVREIDPLAQSVLVPTFVLQPLAENAIRHGIEPRRAVGTLTIRADVVGGNVRLVVSDDGVGLKAGTQPTTRRGIGIANTEERLRALHGDAAHLDIIAPETGGVQVQIVIPRRTVAATAAAPATTADSASATTRTTGAAGAAGASA